MAATPVLAPVPWGNRQPVRSRQGGRLSGRLASAALCLLPLAGLAAEPRAVTRGCPAPNEWAGPRGNPTLDARSPLKGRITAPRLAWKQGVGAVETRLIIAPGPDSRPCPLPAPGASTPPADVGAADWGLTALAATLGDQTHPAERTRNTTYADVLPDTPGLERLDFESGFDKPTVNGRWQPCSGRCSTWRNGAWQKAWETAPIELLFQALPLVGDYGVRCYDTATGNVEWRLAVPGLTNPAGSASADIDGDGRQEALFTQGNTLTCLGTLPGAVQGAVRWTFALPATVGPPALAAVDRSGEAVILLVGADGFVYAVH